MKARLDAALEEALKLRAELAGAKHAAAQSTEREKKTTRRGSVSHVGAEERLEVRALQKENDALRKGALGDRKEITALTKKCAEKDAEIAQLQRQLANQQRATERGAGDARRLRDASVEGGLNVQAPRSPCPASPCIQGHAGPCWAMLGHAGHTAPPQLPGLPSGRG